MTPLIDVIFLPRDLVKSYGFKEFHNIFSPIVMGRAAVILAHEDNGHIGEELRQFMAGLHHSGGVHGNRLFNGDNRKSNSLLDDDGSVYGHGKHL